MPRFGAPQAAIAAGGVDEQTGVEAHCLRQGDRRRTLKAAGTQQFRVAPGRVSH
jgi:hypothetical protein